MKILIEPVHFTADQSLIEYIEKKVGKLEQFFDKIIDVQVTLKLENSGQVKDKVVEILVSVPGDRIFSQDTQKTFEAATDKAVAGLKRQLIRRKEMMRAY